MLTLLPTPIGNIEDISLRALRVLGEADVLLCEDTRVARKLLHLLSERHGLNHSIQRFVSLHSYNEAERLETFDRAFFEQNVVYMSDAGMPCISDPGALLVAYCRKHGIDYTVLPGPSAFTTAYAAGGFSESRFIFYGFLPHKGKARESELQALVNERYPVIFYEAPHRLEKLLDELEKNAPGRTIFAAKEITKKHERYFKGTPAELKAAITGSLLKGEWVVILSPAEKPSTSSAILPQEIEELDLPLRQKAKLIARITGKPAKICYQDLLSKTND